LVHEDRYVPSNILPTLAPSIAKDQHELWCDKLAEVLKQEKQMPRVIVGTTGGLRKAVAQGVVNEAQIQTFAETLARRFGGQARLAQLSGEEEAEFELTAVRYIASRALGNFRPSFGGGIQRVGDEVGVLSCGGASSQIAYHPSELQRDKATSTSPKVSKFLSLNTNLLDAIATARKFGQGSWKGDAFAYTEDLMWKHIAEAGATLGKLRGTFVVIELAGSIGKEAGLADRLVPKREAVQLLTQHLESMQRLAGKDQKIQLAEDEEGKPSQSQRTPESVNFLQEARIPLTIITLALLDLFSSHAFFYFGTSFQVGKEANILRTQWPLGFFLKEMAVDKERPVSKL